MEKLTLAERMERSLHNARERGYCGYYGPKTAAEMQQQERALKRRKAQEQEQAAWAGATAALSGFALGLNPALSAFGVDTRRAGMNQAFDEIMRKTFEQAVAAALRNQRNRPSDGMYISGLKVRNTDNELGVLIRSVSRDEVYQHYQDTNLFFRRKQLVARRVARQKSMVRSYFFWLNERMREVMR